jgi:hypothetical protein
MIKIINRISLVCIVLLICSCSEEKIRKVGLRGSLQGYVYYYHPAEGVQLLANAMITLEGTDPVVTVYTDSNGKFSTSNLETGTYHINFSKPGYGTFKMLGYSFVGGNIPSTITTTLYALPEIKIKDVDAVITKNGNYVSLNGAIFIDDPESGSNIGYFRYYLSQKSDVSSTRYTETGILGFFSQGSSNQFAKGLDTKRFPGGSDLYMVIHPCSDQFSYYLDLETGNRIYSSISENSSSVISLKVPN